MNIKELHHYISLQKLSYLQGKIKDVEFIAAYLVLYLQYKYGKWLCGKHPNATKIPAEYTLQTNIPGLILPQRENLPHRLVDLVSQYNFISTKRIVNDSITQWALGNRPFVLLFHIPTVDTVMNQMINGSRCVTAFTEYDELTLLIKDDYPPFKDRNCMEFMVHDLIHMEHFVNPLFHKEQVGFFKLCAYVLEWLSELHDELFKQDVHHVVSDMNACSVHLFMFLKAKWIGAANRCMSQNFDSEFEMLLVKWLVEKDSELWIVCKKLCNEPVQGDLIRQFFENNY